MDLVFFTERLTVRELMVKDYDAFHDLQSNSKVMMYTGQAAMAAHESKADFESVMARMSARINFFWVWAITDASTNDLVGTCALVKNETEQWEIGYRIRESYWGRGFGMEVTKGLLDYALSTKDINQVHAVVAKKNTHSLKILDALMIFEKEHFNEEEKLVDRSYSLSKKQWLG